MAKLIIAFSVLTLLGLILLHPQTTLYLPIEKKPLLNLCEEDCLDFNSPNNNIKVVVNLDREIKYSIWFHKKQLLSNNQISLDLGGGEILGKNPKIIKIEKGVINDTLAPIVPLKNAKIEAHCSVVKLFLENNYQVEFRVYDDAVAYRFGTNRFGNLTIYDEESTFNFTQNHETWGIQPDGFHTNYEGQYFPRKIKACDSSFLLIPPLLVDAKSSYKILLTESDLFDYPALFFQGNRTNSFHAEFPKYPLKTVPKDYTKETILQEADYIAKTRGRRNFPWRIMIFANQDKSLAESETVFQLSRPNAIENPSWIAPGQSAWEWYHDANIYNADFEAGINTPTYKYYIDFAAHFGLPYLIIDEGWYASPQDPFHTIEGLDLPYLIDYGKQKGVKIFLWLPWLTVHQNPDIFKTFSEWGIAGMKVDFMHRSDQWMINFYTRTAQAAAENHLLLNFHGSIKPSGLNRTYPNVLAFEGVYGMENNTCCGGANPTHHTILPFTRNVAGPVDYTPGSMNSVHWQKWQANRRNPIGIGTRAHQMALFGVLESGLQVLAENPILYYEEEECTSFISQIPVTWDQTIVLEAKVRSYFIVARKKGTSWFISGINNEDKDRSFNISLDFLQDDKNYTTTAFIDGTNARAVATDYEKVQFFHQKNDTLKIDMIKGGGWIGKMELTAALPQSTSDLQ